MKKIVAIVAMLCGVLVANAAGSASENDVLRYVDPYIGTGGHGHVTVSACVPFGFVQLGPSSVTQGWDWCSGYHQSDSTVIGFPHTHLSGTGCGDLHDVTVMPVVGEVKYARGRVDRQGSGLWSYSDRSRERVEPGYYTTRLSRYDVGVELTATARTGLHRYTFPASRESAIVFDLVHGGGWDEVNYSGIKVENDTTIIGFRRSDGWAKGQVIYFVAVFSKPFTASHLMNIEGTDFDSDALQSRGTYGRFDFVTSAGEQIMLKVGLSAVSIEGAKRNLEAEQPGWDFEGTVRKAKDAWRDQLAKITINTPDEHTKRIFYTAMYHTMIAPSVFNDVDGSYQGSDYNTHENPGFTNYTTFSLWDTYRTAHPLMTIIHPEMMGDIINSMLRIYQEQGKLPIWHLMGRETNCMVGTPAVPVVADAIMKGYGGFDRNLALEAMQQSLNLDERGQKWHRSMGYIPYDSLESESVAYELEYDLAEWALGQAAQAMGRDDVAKVHLQRSQNYRRLFDPVTGFMRARDAKGAFREPFDPYKQRRDDDEYCEGNAWQYTWLVPHDIDGLVQCFGGKDRLISKLDSLFTVSSDVGEDAVLDISGLIGQYAHGNEPSHHIIYFYTMLGEPWKTANRVREVLATLYNDTPDGLSGNEDVGQMSAWYILSALGFYQVEPAGGRYYFGSPIVDGATLKVKGGTFNIKVKGNSATNKYIQRIKLNGKPLTKPYIDFADIERGGNLLIEMGNKAKKWW